MANCPDDFTHLLGRAENGDEVASQRLFPLIYDELRRMAAAQMSRESAPQTLQVTALVHEAWLRLGGDEQPDWENRSHFFGAAAQAMRRIMVDRARQRSAKRRGGDLRRTTFDDEDPCLAVFDSNDEGILAVHEALDHFTEIEPEKARLVQLRYFAGLRIDESALALGISKSTAKRWWSYARAWLKVEMVRLRE